MKCTLFFGIKPCAGDVVARDMCTAHYQRWQKGERGPVLNRVHRFHDKQTKSPLCVSLESLCRAQSDPLIQQEKTLHGAGWIVTFASIS